MLRVINSLFPNYQINNTKSPLPYAIKQLSISTNNAIFFLPIISSSIHKSFLPNIQKRLSSILSNHLIEISIVPCEPQNQEGLIIFSPDSLLQICCPLDFLSYISNALHFSISIKQKSLVSLHQELYRFYPQLLNTNDWFNIPIKDLQNLFNHMLSNHIATPKMFALFFKKIPISNTGSYFSKRITKEIQEEYTKLSNTEPDLLLNSVYYIIERNIILHLYQKDIEALHSYYCLINYYHTYFLDQYLPNLHLQKLRGIQSLITHPSFTLFINKISHNSIISFLQHSHPDNKEIIRKHFSNQGYTIIQEDIMTGNRSILESKEFLFALAKLEYNQSGLSFEDIVIKYIKNPRDWELLARECDFQDLLLSISSLHTSETKNLQGIIKHIYHYYQQKTLLFPKIEQRSILKAKDSCGQQLFYLKFLGLLSEES